ncbi:MAG: ferritin [Phycisphaerae bacterium]|nr:ferritin [Phycisphaerae bacterium]
MLNSKIEQALNKQINAELFSSYLYLSMSAWLENKGLKGMAHWMRMQADEEHVHALKFMDYVHERGGKVVLAAIDGPKTEWKSPLEVFAGAYEHECKVTGLINGLVDLALAEKDHATNAMLQWFVTEQVEEEAAAQEIVDRLKLAGDAGGMLFMIDRELGQRGAPATPAS